MERSQSTAYGCVSIILMILIIIIAVSHCNAQWVIPQSMISRDSKYVTQDPGTLVININRAFDVAKYQNGDFFGHIEASDPDSGDVIFYTIFSGNTNYRTFRFGNPNSPGSTNKDYTGNLYINNANGIYKKDGTFRYDSQDLIVQVTDSGGLRCKAHVIITYVDPPSQINYEIGNFELRKSFKLFTWKNK